MDAGLEAELRDHLANGNKIEAIKLYREQTGAGLNEAKEAIETLERDETLPIPEQRISLSVENEVVSLLEQGRKIEAIKRYREQTGVGLKEAKVAVEEIARQRGISTGSGCFGVILVVMGLGLWAMT